MENQKNEIKTFDDIRSEQKNENRLHFEIMEIIPKLMVERNKQGISQRKLSELSNVAQKTISRIESGINIPNVGTLFKLADALGYEISLVLSKKK